MGDLTLICYWSLSDELEGELQNNDSVLAKHLPPGGDILLKSLSLVASLHSVFIAMVQFHDSRMIMNTSGPSEGNLLRNLLEKRGPPLDVLLQSLTQMIEALS